MVKTAKSDNFPELISYLFIFKPKFNSLKQNISFFIRIVMKTILS